LNPVDARQLAVAIAPHEDKDGETEIDVSFEVNEAADGDDEEEVEEEYERRNYVQLSIDRGDTFFPPQPTPFCGNITSMKWSGDGAYLYMIDSESNVARCTGTEALDCQLVSHIDNAVRVFDLVIDPTHSNRLFVVSVDIEHDFRSPKVFQSNDGGKSWVDMTHPHSLLARAQQAGGITYIQNEAIGADAVVVGTSNGILVLPRGGDWRLLAAGIPALLTLQLVYEPQDDTLVVAVSLIYLSSLTFTDTIFDAHSHTSFIFFFAKLVCRRLDEAFGTSETLVSPSQRRQPHFEW
jgi:hypothetical protein